jgi:hypothetical protein
MSVSTCKIAVILYILNIINIFDDPFHTKSQMSQNIHRGVELPNKSEFIDTDNITWRDQRENIQITDNTSKCKLISGKQLVGFQTSSMLLNDHKKYIWVEIKVVQFYNSNSSWGGVRDIALSDKVCQWLAAGL